MDKSLKKIKALKTIDNLVQAEIIHAQDASSLEKVAKQFNVSITPAIAELVKLQPHGPIYQQFVPQIAELNHTTAELADPTGDFKYEKVKGLIHRYPDRCLLKVVNVCPVYCRFCFRKEMIGAGSESMSSDDLATAFDYIHKNPAIWEVILTGGDPLILKPSHLQRIINQLNQIDHVEVIRIHSRVPIVDAARITEKLINSLKSDKALYITVHVNHPDELTHEVINRCAALVDAGIPLLSQSVLLKGVNDDPEVLKKLFRSLVKNRIKPYYLHHPDLVRGTSHFRLPISEGQALMKQLQGHISGLCLPTYVVDVPGGGGKVPIGPSYVEHTQEGCLLENYLGDVFSY